jgi:serine/threonine-protein kinase
MGDTSFGKYRLIAELGHGGMADVFLAVQAGPAGSGFSKLTVIKRLRPNLADEPEFVSMLVDEARIAARLNHPNVVQTNEVGEVDRHYFISMEYLDGQPFHRIQHRAMQRAKDGTSPLTKEQQYLVLMDALAGLHHAHELADYDGTPLTIVHRDITPHNIFVTYEGQVKVVDFGIAKAVGRASETRQGVVKGKVRYMAPEQAIGQDVDRRADIFGAGVILWEIAVGRRMWKDMDDLRIVQDLVGGNLPPSPREADPTVPEPLDRICRRALAPKRDDRYTSAEEFRSDLETFLAEAGHIVEARRKLAPAIAELFKDKRAEVRAIIEKQLSAINSRPSNEMRAVSIPIESNSSSRTPVSVALGDPPMSATSLTDQKTELYTGKKKSPGRAVMLAVAATAVLSLGGVAFWRSNLTPRAQASGVTAADVTTEISLRLSGNAEGASVRIDDGPARNLPLVTKVARDNADHRLSFEAEGFTPKTELVKFANDVVMKVELAPKTVAAPTSATPPKDHDRKPPPVAYTPWRPHPPPVAKTPDPTPQPTPETPKPPDAPERKGPNRLGIDKGDPWANPANK